MKYCNKWFAERCQVLQIARDVMYSDMFLTARHIFEKNLFRPLAWLSVIPCQSPLRISIFLSSNKPDHTSLSTPLSFRKRRFVSLFSRLCLQWILLTFFCLETISSGFAELSKISVRLASLKYVWRLPTLMAHTAFVGTLNPAWVQVSNRQPIRVNPMVSRGSPRVWMGKPKGHWASHEQPTYAHGRHRFAMCQMGFWSCLSQIRSDSISRIHPSSTSNCSVVYWSRKMFPKIFVWNVAKGALAMAVCGRDDRIFCWLRF